MTYTGFELLWLFFICSFMGWAGETAWAAVRECRYVDKSALCGPVCAIYGITAVVLALGLYELKDHLFFLFLGSALLATVIEWAGGHFLENVSHTRWWDYSHRRFNLDGYICLGASVLWGLLGVVSVRWGNGILLFLYHLMPAFVGKIVIWIMAGLLAVDILATGLTLAGLKHRMPRVDAVGNQMALISLRLGLWILGRTERRIQNAHPEAVFARIRARERSQVFAQGCGFYKIVLLFVIGSFLGDVTETIFCRLKAGVWMSRSSLVWGPFSIVWGFALAAATLLLYKYKDRSDRFLCLVGTFLGGAYEYLCSVFTELVFGTVFWDYSEIPFNLGGRINLLYCFFWGIAAVVWMKAAYPAFSRWIEKIPRRAGKPVTWVLLVFMAVNMGVSALALARYVERNAGVEARAGWEIQMDERFDDARMERIYPNMISVE